MNNVILLLSGPNLDELGVRDPSVYGAMTLDEHVERFRAVARDFSCDVEHCQSNFEGDLIEAIHGARQRAVAIVINAGALTTRRGRYVTLSTPLTASRSRSISPIPRLASRFDTSVRWPESSTGPSVDSAL